MCGPWRIAVFDESALVVHGLSHETLSMSARTCTIPAEQQMKKMQSDVDAKASEQQATRDCTERTLV